MAIRQQLGLFIQGGFIMNRKFFFEMEKGGYKVPMDELLFVKNYEYFHGMGIYAEAACQEKALLITGFRIVSSYEDNQ